MFAILHLGLLFDILKGLYGSPEATKHGNGDRHGYETTQGCQHDNILNKRHVDNARKVSVSDDTK